MRLLPELTLSVAQRLTLLSNKLVSPCTAGTHTLAAARVTSWDSQTRVPSCLTVWSSGWTRAVL